MNQFTARKLGEVCAFLQLNIDTYERAHQALTSVIDSPVYMSFMDAHKQIHQRIVTLSTEQDSHTTVTEKADATYKKLATMRDAYIGDEWENPTEIYEWQGFAGGAGSAHAALVLGAAEASDNKTLAVLAKDAFNLLHDHLHDAQEYLATIGKQRGVE